MKLAANISLMPGYDSEEYKRYYEAHAEKLRAKSRAYYHAKRKHDPEQQAKARARSKEWYEAHRQDPEFKAKRDERNAQWREENRDAYLAWRREYRKRVASTPEGRAQASAQRERYRTRKIPLINGMIATAKGGGCLVCGESDHQCLDFHHLDPSAKSFSIGTTRYQKLHRPLDILLEIEKCVVLCANCHRKVEVGSVVLPSATVPIAMPTEWLAMCEPRPPD